MRYFSNSHPQVSMRQGAAKHTWDGDMTQPWGLGTHFGAQCLKAALRSHPTPGDEPRLLPGLAALPLHPRTSQLSTRQSYNFAHLIVPLKLHRNDNCSLPSLKWLHNMAGHC